MGTITAERQSAHEQNVNGVLSGAHTAPVPRYYQENNFKRLRELYRQHRSLVLVEPCGAGKGFECAWMVRSFVRAGKHVIFMVHGQALVYDMSRRVSGMGIEHGVIMGKDPREKPWELAHVASIDTLHRRKNLPPADFIIADEAHLTASPTWKKVLDRYPDAKILGLTATPVRLDGKALGSKWGGLFEDMVIGPSATELIKQKLLVPSRTFGHESSPDLDEAIQTFSHKKKVNEQEQAAVFDRKKLVGDIVSHWRRLSWDRKTAAFGVNQHHAHSIAEEFRCAGIDFAYVDADTPSGERERVWEDLDTGRLMGVSGVGVFGYGWDHNCWTIIQGYHSDSLVRHLQNIGRASRPWIGKDHFLVLDHGGNAGRHGFYEDDREWFLDGRVINHTEDRDGSVRMCHKCLQHVRSGLSVCPYCGAVRVVKEREIETVEAELTELLPRVVCDSCKREMTGDKVGDWCDPRVAEGLATCKGSARRAYEVKKLDRNPKVAEIQKLAHEKAFKQGYVYTECKRLGLRMWGS